MKVKYFSLLYLLTCIFIKSAVQAQILSVSPAFPTMDDTVTIIYNAALGNQALKDKNTNIYIHTGLITENSVSATDWKYVQGVWGTTDNKLLMMPLGNNEYSIRYHLKSFYRINTNEKVLQMAFVFRNADGSIVGRDPQGSDIYYDLKDLSQNLQTRWESISSNFGFCKVGDLIDCSIIVSEVADINLFIDNQLVQSQSTQNLKYVYKVNDLLRHDIKAEINNKKESKSIYYTCLPSQNSPIVKLPLGMKMGANILPDSIIRFVLAAPFKKSVYLLPSINNFQPQLMNLSDDGYSFWTDLKISSDEKIFYQYLIDDNLFVADPLSQLVLDTKNDPSIPSTVYPDLPKVRDAQIKDYVSVISYRQDPFPWTNNNFEPPKKEKLNIYEILIRDFDNAHSYDAIVARLDYLKNLGINAIELMPVNEFEGNKSWGYNIAIPQAIDKYYGTISSFKNLIDQCHNRGIAVILDVVFNHAFSQSPVAKMYWDAANNRPSSNSPYLNTIAKHPYNVGSDMNHESPFTKRYVNQILSYLLNEYKIDGFRFDLSKGFTQTDYGNDVDRWSRYDASRVNILKNYANQIWSVNKKAYVILEHFAENIEEIELSNYGMLLWANMNYNYSQWSMAFTNNNLNGVLASARNWKNNYLIGYMESHDEERVMYRNLLFGNASGNYKIKDLKTALRRIEMSNVFLWLLPGPKMLWQFGELGYEYSINTCVGGSVNTNCRLDPKPIRWDYLEDSARLAIYKVLSKILYLRNNFELIHQGTLDAQIQEGLVKQITLTSQDLNLLAVANGDVVSRSRKLKFPHQGTWYNYLTNDSIKVDNNDFEINLNPGDYNVWLDKKIETIVSVEDISRAEISIQPNPASHFINIKGIKQISLVKIFDISGKLIFQEEINFSDSANVEINLPNGLYIISITSLQNSYSHLLHVVK